MTARSGLPGPDEPGRLHPLSLVAGPFRILGGWALPLLVALVLGLRSDGFGGFELVLLALVFAVGRQVIEYLRLRWWVTDEGVELRTGFLQVEQRSLPFDRIQNVDVNEPIVARLVGLAEVRIESAASGSTDIALRYVPVADALTIRDELVGHAPSTGDALDEDREPARALVEVPLSELLVAGATSNRIGALAAGVAAVVGVLFQAGVDPGDLLDEAAGLVPIGLTIGIVFVIGAIVVGWIVSIAESVLRYADFTLTLEGDEARRVHGLLSRSSGRIPLPRVQTVRVEQALLRRWLGRATILADTAGSLASGTESGTGVVAPIVGVERVPELASTMLRRPGTDAEHLQPVSRLAIRRGFVRGIIPVVVVLAVPAILLSPWWATALVVVAPLVWVWARARWRAIGHRLDRDLLVVRSGVLTRRIWFIPTDKVQSVAVVRTVFQRRLGLGSLRIDSAATADGVITVIDLEHDTARRLAEALADRSSATAFAPDGV
ncbi:MAG: PH domain-containing protein [Acidimicrobiia bacterium]